jgi:hypothetical protein
MLQSALIYPLGSLSIFIRRDSDVSIREMVAICLNISQAIVCIKTGCRLTLIDLHGLEVGPRIIPRGQVPPSLIPAETEYAVGTAKYVNLHRTLLLCAEL